MPEKTRDVLASLDHLTSPIDKKNPKLNRTRINRNGNLPPVGWMQHTRKISENRECTKSLNETLAEEREIYQKIVADIKAKEAVNNAEKNTKGKVMTNSECKNHQTF